MHNIACTCTDDLSKKKVSTQSTTSLGPSDVYSANNAVDRDKTTCMRTEAIGTSRQIPDKTVWWRVDLGGVYSIYSVNILFKNYEGYGIFFTFLMKTINQRTNVHLTHF